MVTPFWKTLLPLLPSVKFSEMSWLKAIISGVLIWIAISLVVFSHQPATAGSVVATMEMILSLVLAVIACCIIRW